MSADCAWSLDRSKIALPTGHPNSTAWAFCVNTTALLLDGGLTGTAATRDWRPGSVRLSKVVDIRPSAPADLEEVASWIRSQRDVRLWAGWRVDFPIDRQSLPSAINFKEDNAISLIWGNELVAFGQLLENPSRRGHLARIIVHPDFRGRGYGEKLVRALLDRGRKAGLQTISLNVDSVNPAAVSLYLKLGFADATRPLCEPESPGSRYMELSVE